MMARLITFCGLGLAILLTGSTSASAQDFGFSFGGSSCQSGRSSFYSNRHGNYHDNLRHRDFQRQLYSREAHRYPMTHRNHGRLHHALESAAFHDQLNHRAAHRNGYFTPNRCSGMSGRNFSMSGRNFNMRFGGW